MLLTGCSVFMWHHKPLCLFPIFRASSGSQEHRVDGWLFDNKCVGLGWRTTHLTTSIFKVKSRLHHVQMLVSSHCVSSAGCVVVFFSARCCPFTTTSSRSLREEGERERWRWTDTPPWLLPCAHRITISRSACWSHRLPYQWVSEQGSDRGDGERERQQGE